jgi:hypothetical protein
MDRTDSGSEMPVSRQVKLILVHPGGFAQSGGVDYTNAIGYRLVDVATGEPIGNVTRVEHDLGRGHPSTFRITFEGIEVETEMAGHGPPWTRTKPPEGIYP